MTTRAVGLLVLMSLALTPGLLRAQEIGDEEGAREGALFLLLPVGAQGVGLGRAMTALASDEAAFWNPAGLAEQTRRRVMIYRGSQLAGDATAVNVLLPWERVGTFGVSYLLLDIGDQDLRDGFGNVLGKISIRNHAGLLSYAASFPGRIYAGVNLKLVQFRVACRGQCPDLDTTSSAYALDVGLQAEPFERIPLRFGWMLAHAGPILPTRSSRTRFRPEFALRSRTICSAGSKRTVWRSGSPWKRKTAPGIPARPRSTPA